MITFVRSNGLYALAALLSLGFFYFGLLFPAEQRLRDWRFGFASHAPGGELVLVDIDAKSISEMGTWPWPRSTYGNLVDRLNELGALEIAFDVDFSSRSSPAEDQAFADAIGRSEATVFLANFVQPSRSGSSELIVNKPIQSLNDLSWPATVNVYSDADGAVRSFPFGEQIGDEPVQSIAAVMAGYTGSLNGSFLVNFGIDVDAIDRVSLIDILNGNVEAHRISDKKIIVGAIAAELRDFFNVPKYGIISGHTLQAVAAETLASNRQLRVQPFGTVYPAVCLLGLLGMLAWRRRNWKLNLALCTGSLVVIEAVAIAVQASYSYALVTAPVHALLVISLVLTIVTEIDVGNILLRISRSQASRTKTILDRVIQDNFDGIVVVDASGAIHMANSAAAVLLNIPETGSENADVPDSGRQLSKVLPAPIYKEVQQAQEQAGRGDWSGSSPKIHDNRHHGEKRQVIEYVVTPSLIEGEVSNEGRQMGDQVIVCIHLRDVTKRRIAEEREYYMARFDQLTGLPNENQFLEALKRVTVLSRSMPNSGEKIVVASIAIDGFKSANLFVDDGLMKKLLGMIAGRIKSNLSDHGFLASRGSKGFIFVYSTYSDETEMGNFMRHVLSEIEKPYLLEDNGAIIQAKLGFAVADSQSNAEHLLKNADTALMHADKQADKQVQLFSGQMHGKILQNQRLELDLWKALERRELEAFYQPQICMETGKPSGAEALVRWNHPELGQIGPGKFITIAEQSSLIVDIGNWMLERACRDAVAWPDHMVVAVNVSPAQFTHTDLVDLVSATLKETGLPAERLVLEITESLFIGDHTPILKVMRSLKQMGVRFALDDFGTGYSSLAYIKDFPLDKIKIDQSFLYNVHDNPGSLAIIRSVTALANDLNMQTVAEGIETAEQRDLMKAIGCTFGQGYLFGRPMPIADFIAIVHEDEPALESPHVQAMV